MYEYSGRVDINILPKNIPASVLIRGVKYNDDLYTTGDNGHVHSWLLSGINISCDRNKPIEFIKDKNREEFIKTRKISGLYIFFDDTSKNIVCSKRVGLQVTNEDNGWSKKEWNFRLKV